MSYKSILVPLNGTDLDSDALACAYQVALISNGHIKVLHVQADSKEAVPLLGEGMSGAMIEEMIDLAERDAEVRFNLAHHAYDKFIAETGIAELEKPDGEFKPSIDWLNKIGREDEIVSRGGRISDLTVIAHTKSNNERASLMTLHAAIFETGKPVLIVPPGFNSKVGKRVLIAWNGTYESSSSISAAMPFLRYAEAISILTVETKNAASGISAEELSKSLAWHGVVSTIKKVSTSTESVGAKIISECTTMNADLLVFGAYSHSRLIQLILGGVTRHLISESKIPILTAH